MLLISGFSLVDETESVTRHYDVFDFSADDMEKLDYNNETQGSFTTLTVNRADTLSSMLYGYGIKDKTIYQLSKSTHGKILNRLNVGDRLSVLIEYDRLEQLIYEPSNLEAYHFIASQDGFNSVHRRYEVETYLQLQTFSIDDSLFWAGKKANLTDAMIVELAGIFAWDIDFAVDLRRGDRFTLVYEELLHNGEKIGEGNILAAEFINKGKVYRAIRFTEENGSERYFDENGKSMQRAFLRTPLDIFRISSHFNPHRKHPVLNRIRAHKGTDYAAPRGTVVRATGDGIVKFAGREGGYGNLIKIQHGDSRETRYAHLDKFNKRVKKGRKVKQGQVIGYVGKTGLATGYHLHYEFLSNGVHRNPVKVKFPKSNPIVEKDKQRFNEHKTHMLAVLNNATQYFVKR